MKVLLIGGTGLISTSIARQLLERGDAVTLFNRGKSPSRVPSGYETIQGDRGNYAAFEAAFAEKTYDVVVNMVAFRPEDTESAIRAFKDRTGQFIHCSTVCVYSGPMQTVPTPETEPYHSIGSYGKNKAKCEEILFAAHKRSDLNMTIMRPSHSYGEGGSLIRPFGPAETFIDRLRQGKPVIVPGDGNGLWASCHVDDVARGFIGVMGNPKCAGEAYHIAGDEYLTWNRYHEQVAEVAGGTHNPVYIPPDILQKALPNQSGGMREIFMWPGIFDNAKIKRDTDYQGQTITWREGARRTISWMEENGKIASSTLDVDEDRFLERWKTAMETL